MPDGQVLEFDRVTKRFSDVTAVSDFSGRVEPGVVTGFLGPNGAGKTTTLRMLLGQIRPTSGTATIGGAQYSDLKHPARIIGAMPEDPGFRPRRSVERHLVIAAKANGIALSRVSEVISFVGLDGEAGTRIGALSLGMRQRLSAATALLGDPGALVLDEPANGLDPEGIRWMRMLIRGLADEGRTVLVSSHVLSEVEQVADEILVIAHGERKFAGSLASLADPTAGPVVVDAVDRNGLTDALRAAGFEFEVLRSGLTVRGSDARTIGTVAAQAGVALTTLQQRGPTLEDVFLDLVNDRPVQLRKPEAADATVAVPVVAALAGVADTDAAPVADQELAVDDAEPDAEESPADADAAEADAVDGIAEDGGEADPAATEDDSVEAASVDEDEDDDAEDEEDAEGIEVFAPISAAEDRPLPGVADLAAAAAGLSRSDEGSEAPSNPAVSDAWAALLTGRPLDESAEEDDAQEQLSEDSASPASDDSADEVQTASDDQHEPSHQPESDESHDHLDEADAPAAPDSDSSEAEYTEFAHEQHVADGDDAPVERGEQHDEDEQHDGEQPEHSRS
ncbi:ATP-binding cassette domain-containing protein [Microbacterium sp. M28]|uniref:ATP-binding cassette domain-containing protein n=1 Tax=Microbacterium sp. M28 TaxID=2962064 RepID=UPI0021F49D1E|nr:ATP-binding cassette domain-containing protein [Microbacterium sp. M28]UYO97412.1 ATP-binding cassette domain-containing protein [Microbacterium sp. M28]